MTHYNVSRSFSSASQIKSYRIPRIRFKFRFPITFGDRCRQCICILILLFRGAGGNG